jgi:LytS/YehU family sensor histidine kinase
MKLMNGKASTASQSQKKPGIGIKNVRQRLELLYKNKYVLHVREEDEVFVVDLQVDLVRIESRTPATHSAVLQIPINTN